MHTYPQMKDFRCYNCFEVYKMVCKKTLDIHLRDHVTSNQNFICVRSDPARVENLLGYALSLIFENAEISTHCKWKLTFF